MYTEKYKTLMKGIKDTNKWEDIRCSWIGRISIVYTSILLKAVFRFNAIPIKIPWHFNRNRKKNPKIQMELQKT